MDTSSHKPKTKPKSKAPKHRYGRCETCPRPLSYVPVYGYGKHDALVMVIGEAPAKWEDKRGIPFVGDSGRELDNQYLQLANIDREACWVTNACKCSKPGFRSPDKAEGDACAGVYLSREIAHTKPKLVITLGAVALHVVAPDLQINTHHGVPVRREIFGHSCWLFPAYHPAYAMRDGKIQAIMREDFALLGRFVSRGITVPEDDYPNPAYRELTSGRDVWQALDADPWEHAIDTESDLGAFWCATISAKPGTGYMLRAGSSEALDAYREYIAARNPLVWMHNAPYDMGELAKARVHYRFDRVRDTMVHANLCGNLSQGLKTLSYRLCGMAMEDYEDVVTPYGVALALDYLRTAGEWRYSEPHMEGTRKKRIDAKIRRLVEDYKADTQGKVDLYKRWDEWKKETPESIGTVEAQNGPLPRPSIALVPYHKALYYACRDADATYRLRRPLRQRLAKFRTRHFYYLED